MTSHALYMGLGVMAVTVEFVTRRARERTVRSISSLPAVLMIDMYIYMLVKYASVSQNNNRLVGLSIRFCWIWLGGYYRR